MKRIAWIVIATTAFAAVALAAPPAKPPLTGDAKLKLIEQATKSKVTGLQATVRLSARKLYDGSKAGIVVTYADRVDGTADFIQMHADNPTQPKQRIEVGYKPGKANQTVLIDVHLTSKTAGPAKMAISSGSVRQEVTVAANGEEHLTLVSTPTTTAWQAYKLEVTQGNIAVDYVELSPVQ